MLREGHGCSCNKTTFFFYSDGSRNNTDDGENAWAACCHSTQDSKCFTRYQDFCKIARLWQDGKTQATWRDSRASVGLSRDNWESRKMVSLSQDGEILARWWDPHKMARLSVDDSCKKTSLMQDSKTLTRWRDSHKTERLSQDGGDSHKMERV